MPYLTSNYVAKRGVKGMLKGKYLVTLCTLDKIDKIAGKILPDRIIGSIVGRELNKMK